MAATSTRSVSQAWSVRMRRRDRGLPTRGRDQSWPMGLRIPESLTCGSKFGRPCSLPSPVHCAALYLGLKPFPRSPLPIPRPLDLPHKGSLEEPSGPVSISLMPRILFSVLGSGFTLSHRGKGMKRRFLSLQPPFKHFSNKCLKRTCLWSSEKSTFYVCDPPT